MKKLLALLMVFCCVASFGAPAYFMLKHGNAANGSVEGQNPEKVILKMKTVASAKKNHIVACRNIKMDVTAQKKIMFRLKGASHLGAGAHVTVAIAYTANGSKKWLNAISPNLKVNNKEFKSYTLGLDTEFKLPDSSYVLRQLKFVINGAGLPAGTDMTVEIDNIQIGDAAEGTAGEITVVPPPFPRQVTAGTRKIFFELENDDNTDYIPSRYNPKWLKSGEPVVPAGFAELILENTAGIFSETQNISEADVIVYARVTPGKNGKAISAAAAAGKCVIAAGFIPDKELAAVMPLEVSNRSSQGFAERRTLVFHKSLAAVAPNAAAFPQTAECKRQGNCADFITFSDGKPFLVRRGNICHFANTIGATVEKSDVFFDKLLLRLASDDKTLAALNKREKEVLAKRSAEEKAAARAAGVTGNDWKIGASANNFSRFGWRIGVALSSGTLNNDLSFTSGDQSFKLFNFGSESVVLDKWQMRPVDKGVILPAGSTVLSYWDGKGRVRYKTQAVIPDSWKDLEIAFEVASGIDDTDEFYVNGKLAGKTDTDTKEYWMTPRRYVLDKSRLKFGSENSLQLDVRNINGRAAVLSVPRLTARKAGSSVSITVPSLNWTGRVCKAVSGENSYSVHHTMALPLMLHDFGSSKSASLTLENVARYAAYELAGGKTVIRKFSGSDFYNAHRDGKLAKPWLLLFRTDTSRPLLLVFNRNVEKIEAAVRDGEATTLKIALDGKGNIISAGFPFGAAAVSGAGWDKALPECLRSKIADMVRFSFNWPERIEELYRIDRKTGKVEVINNFRFRHIPNVWGVKEEKYAFLPPLAAYLCNKKIFVGCAEKLTDFNIPTHFGPTCGVTGKSAIRFSYDLPERADFQIPGYTDDVCNARQNTFFADGLRWSCGGRTPFIAWSAARPNGKSLIGCNIDIFAWNFGLNSAMQGIFSLNSENLSGLHHRINTRFLEPVEKYMWKTVLRHRYEPFSGITYPCLLQNYHSLYTPFAKGTGSNVTFGDANEAHAVFMWMCQQLEDLAGQQGLSAANWNLIRYVARYELCIDDYAFQSGSCRDFGTGAWIDMLNCEYGGMMAFARTAELAGDSSAADSALYRAARRAVPTIARMYFRDYFNTLYPEKSRDNLQITGFGEAGAKYMMYPASNFNFMAAMDLFDFSEGFMGTMIRLYDKYARTQVEEHVAKRSYPSLRAQADRKRNCNYAYLPPLAIYLTDDAEFERYAKDTLQYNNRMGDWPAMRRAFEINTYLWRKYGKVTFRDFRNLNIRKAVCDPQAKLLTVDYTSEKNSLLTLESSWSIRSITDNGKTVAPVVKDGVISLPVTPGQHLVKVYFK